jgi:hypothetical protein
VSSLEVHGRDVDTGAYRVSLVKDGSRIAGLVPETIMGGPRSLGTPRHQFAYEWLALNRPKIEAALCAKREGKPVRAPFDRVTLAEEK